MSVRRSEKYRKLFSDKKHSKQSLWTAIALEMNEAGFSIPTGKDGAEKCRQKFANLQRTYMNFVRKVDTTGEYRVERPPYYEEMDNILGDKHKVTVPHLWDTLDTSRSSAIVESPSSSPPPTSVSFARFFLI